MWPPTPKRTRVDLLAAISRARAKLFLGRDVADSTQSDFVLADSVLAESGWGERWSSGVRGEL
jgi:hypothetical protein